MIIDGYLSRTPAQMIARDRWQRLAELGKLTTEYSKIREIWHAFCTGVMISDGTLLYPMSCPGNTQEEATENYWRALVELPEGHAIVINASRADRQAYRWDAARNGWREVNL